MPSARSKSSPARPLGRRCAIYTRKSSEEGLEQAFNSLDAQREACEAYARSQQHEGWTVLAGHYDDGGFSGGTLERPALQRLLADIRAGKVDLVLVYKVDRLTRSLADFAKIVEVFDAHGASFVSVTQHFNTATSMGRLTLNMLLSFAQFEREVAGERIRDKIAASKRKGMWMGGTVPFGYRVRDHKLVVDGAEAETVRHIFRLYREFGSVRLLGDRLAAEGVRSRKSVPFGRGPLFHLLQNRVYGGEVAHKGNVYPGEQEAIVEAELWQAVQRRLAGNRAERRSGTNAANPSLLAGLVFDASGEAMTATHAVKGSRRYRYYISRRLVAGTRDAGADGIRVPAAAIERLVASRIQQFLTNPSAVLSALREGDGLPAGLAEQQQILRRAGELAERWPALGGPEQRAIISIMVRRVEVSTARIDMHVAPAGVKAVLTNATVKCPADAPVAAEGATTTLLSIPVALRRAGKEMALLIGKAATPETADPSLVRLIAKAWSLRQALVKGDADSLAAAAAREGISAPYASRLIRLAWLAPDIVQAILQGRQPAGLSATRLIEDWRLPLDWQEQRSLLGFA